mmetsp:Transcript_30106/g.72264  ORF Transcript_30106/g.72264 Transcript_30106/m.72264 type:complete len:563 (-) Transcript_30106:98-1786(-)
MLPTYESLSTTFFSIHLIINHQQSMSDSKSTKLTTKGRVAVIGAGISGIGAAHVWERCGYDAVVYDAAEGPGGQWRQAYPGVRLQNVFDQYRFPSFPWPFEPDRHPTKEQILRYLELAVEEFDLNMQYEHRVINIQRSSVGSWDVTVQKEGSKETKTESFCYVVLATGQYPWGDKKHQPSFPNREVYEGTILTNMNSVKEDFANKKVAVVGFGKTALDLATCASTLDTTTTTHIFRTARWSLPDRFLGMCYTYLLFGRFSTDLMPSWCHSSTITRFLHSQMPSVVNSFWSSLIATVVSSQNYRDAKISQLPKKERLAAKERLELITPPKDQFVKDLRSAFAMCPENYMANVASGRLQVKQAEVEAFTPFGLKLSNGEEVEADVVCICCGNESPSYSHFFDPNEREGAILKESEAQEGGIVLYRHVIHPSIPGLGFSGNNHGFLHTSLVELGALWMVAAFESDLELPTVEEQLASANRVAQYKQENSTFEPTYNMAVSTRFQQHLDMLCQDLGLNPWRKLPNPVKEYFQRYGPGDYASCVEEYMQRRQRRKGKKQKVVFEADV